MVSLSSVTSTIYHDELVSTAEIIISAIPHDIGVHGH